MDTLLFFVMFAGAWLVLGWYVHNEIRKTPGTAGLLAIRNDARPSRDGGAAYRVRARRARPILSNLPDADNPARYQTASEARSYRAVERVSYSDRGSAYREKTRANDVA